GRIISVTECEALVERIVGVPFEATPDALAAVSLGYIVLRMLTNLKGVYQRQRDHARTARVAGRLCQLSPEDPMQQRDLGISLLQAGRAGQAIGPLERYLKREPPPEDARQIREVLAEAQMEVARWN